MPFFWDDMPQILQNEYVQDISNFADLSDWTAVNNRTLAKFTIALNWQMGGVNVLGYHIVNMLFHILAAFVAYLLARHAISLISDNDRFDQRMNDVSALFVALLFILHPLQTMAVTYIVQRMTLMAALFYLLAVFLYAHGRQTYLSNRNRRRSYVLLGLAILAGVLGIMSKQNAASFPLAFILYEIFFIRKPDGGTCKKYIYTSLSIFLVAFIVIAFAGWLPAETDQYTRLEYFTGQLGILPEYLLLVIFPVGQNVDHFIILDDPLFGIAEIIGSLIFAGLLIIGALTFKKNKLISFGIFWFFITMSVESGIIPIRDLMMEHRMYLPLFGIGMVLAGIILRYVPKKSEILMYLGGVIVLFLLGFSTFQRNTAWASELSLWQDSYNKNPENPRAMVNLGNAIEDNAKFSASEFERKNALQKAITYYTRSMSGDTIFSQAYMQRGLAYLELGDYERALLDIQKVVSKKPRYEYMNLYVEGVILAKQGKLENSLEKLNAGIIRNDEFAKLYMWRGLVNEALKNYHDAKDDYLKSYSLNPIVTILCINISNTYFYLQDLEHALEWILKAQQAGETIDLKYLNMLKENISQTKKLN